MCRFSPELKANRSCAVSFSGISWKQGNWTVEGEGKKGEAAEKTGETGGEGQETVGLESGLNYHNTI